MPDLLTLEGWTGLRYLSPLALLWLAFVFGSTLRSGSTPLIERIARRGSATLSAPLCRYARRLTTIWCAYFVGAAALSAVAGGWGGVSASRIALSVLAGSVLLFVGEHGLRARIFPHDEFPGLLRQLRDTWNVWRAPGRVGSEARR